MLNRHKIELSGCDQGFGFLLHHIYKRMNGSHFFFFEIRFSAYPPDAELCSASS
jgi:hypothetical protein